MSSGLKILHLSSERTWRGGEQQIAYLIEELARHGVKNYVAARAGSVFEAHCLKHDIPVFPLPFRSAVDFITARAIKCYCRVYDIDLVHMHSARSHSLGVLSHVVGNKTPLILSRRVDFVPKRAWFTQWKYNHASIVRVLCVSDKINEIMHTYLKHPEKSMTVHSGVDLAKFTPADIPGTLRREGLVTPGQTLIGNTSALEGHKDYFTFIDTIEKLVPQQPDIRAVIIGTGSLEETLKQYVQQKNLGGVIHFTGFRQDIVDILPELDIFLMTSSEEGLGTSVLDAFLARVPVVATAAGGIPEMVVHEKSGLLAPVGDCTTLAANVTRVINTPALRAALVAGASEKVREFSKERTAERTLAVYREVTGKN
jgi:glycosyltransferase involved in cell wall biosynthesis